MSNEIVLYQPDEISTRIEVRIEDDNVWLNRNQIAELFNRDVKTIGKHINNALNEELCGFQVVAKFATTASDGKVYQVEYFNLDVIISVGYRVKSQRGIQFRIWANKVLKDYLLKGHAINQRFERIEKDIHFLKNKTDEFDLQIRTSLPPNEGIFFEGKVFDAYVFVAGLIKSAKKSIVLIDNYVDESVLTMLSKRKSGVTCDIFTSHTGNQLLLDVEKHNAQYSEIALHQFSMSHDRFLILDNSIVYHIGASLKDLGKRWFAFSKIGIDANEMLQKLRKDSKKVSKNKK
ncbi:MAG TPA: RhuM family protein [Bacteroidales bacterium]|nr:RhuM family protein [Bacteroidales bacterium]